MKTSVLWFILLTLRFCYSAVVKPRVCVIGAGVAGLTTAKHLKDEGIAFTVLEASNHIGGVWEYDPRVGLNEYGEPINAGIYENLRTNLPKPIMELAGYPIPDDVPSYPEWKSYQCYINHFANHFDLFKHIQFLHKVTLIRRVDNVWKVKHKKVSTGEEFEDDYDWVVIGTGIYHKPKYPNIPGNETFQGTKIHSQEYRKASPYKNRSVLIIGLGFSALDISVLIAEEAKKVVLSHHSKKNITTKYPKHYIFKPDVKELNTSGAIFVDNTYEPIDDIVYCTGYEFNYPFLDESCGIDAQPIYVAPLHQNVVNINQPTMTFVGISGLVPLTNAQARYAAAVIKGNFTLPPKQLLLERHKVKVDLILEERNSLKDFNYFGFTENGYYDSLTDESGIYKHPPVIYKIRRDGYFASLSDWYGFRQYAYKIISPNEFNKVKEDESIRSNPPTNCTPFFTNFQ